MHQLGKKDSKSIRIELEYKQSNQAEMSSPLFYFPDISLVNIIKSLKTMVRKKMP